MENKKHIDSIGIVDKQEFITSGAIDKDGNILDKTKYLNLIKSKEQEILAQINEISDEAGSAKPAYRNELNVLYSRLNHLKNLATQNLSNINQTFQPVFVQEYHTEKTQRLNQCTQKIQNRPRLFTILFSKMSERVRN